MSKIAKILTVGFSVAAVAGVAFAQAKPEDMIKFRKAGYSFMGWNMGKIKGMVMDNPASFNKDQVSAAANVVAAIANSGMGALFGAGTDKDVGDQKTNVKPEFFQQSDRVKELALAYIKEANELQQVILTLSRPSSARSVLPATHAILNSRSNNFVSCIAGNGKGGTLRKAWL